MLARRTGMHNRIRLLPMLPRRIASAYDLLLGLLNAAGWAVPAFGPSGEAIREQFWSHRWRRVPQGT